MFGPTGVEEAERGQGIGFALLLRCLNQIRSNEYAVIGGVGRISFTRRLLEQAIKGSTTDVYVDRLRAL